MKLRIILLSVVFAAYSMASNSHDNLYFDTHPTPHGGQMRMAGPFHLELVIRNESLIIYVTDHAGNAASTEGLKGRVLAFSTGGRLDIELAASPDSTMTGSYAGHVITDGSPMVVLLEDGDGTSYQIRFTPESIAMGGSKSPAHE